MEGCLEKQHKDILVDHFNLGSMCNKNFYMINCKEWIAIKEGYATYYLPYDMIRVPEDASDIQSRKIIK